MFQRTILLITAFFYCSICSADYIELRRNANLYPTPERTTQPIKRITHDDNKAKHYLLISDDLINGYFHVRIPDIGDGYIYRTLARRHNGTLPGSQILSTLPTVDHIRLGAWNIKKLGHGSRKDYRTTAAIINDHFDLVAGIEVMQKGGDHPGYTELLSTLGNDWKGVITKDPRPNDTSGHAEFYAILYRHDRIKLCQGWVGIQFALDSEQSFDREPAFSCFVAEYRNNRFDFLLAAYHATWSDGDKEIIATEVENLSRVFIQMKDSAPDEKDLIIVGDFNLVPDDLDLIGFTTQVVGFGSTLNLKGARTHNLYDHLILYDKSQTSELISHLQVLDVREMVQSGSTFYKTISDHLPIVGQFHIAEDDD